MSAWRDEIPTDGAVELPPDPRVLDGLGRNHSLGTALADLVDNSIDAKATDVLIRLVRRCGQLCTLYVADNGQGMPLEVIDTAMTVGGQRKYQPEDLGHFGLGLKAASFSHARTLTVMSKAANRSAVGRQWKVRSNRLDFVADIVPTEICEEEVARPWNIPWTGSGTVVRWDDLGRLARHR
ncbi:MAG: ATP-binding protein [Egibacteraceae bacterium]